MELFVLSDRQLTSVAEWLTAIDGEGYPLQLAPDMRFDRLCGFLPAHTRGEATGFECFHEDAAELIRVKGHANY